MLFIKKKIEVNMEFPIIVYPKIQKSWDGKNYDKLINIRLESAEEYKALDVDFVLNFREVTNSVKPKKVAPPKKQPKLEV
jgi:hypothetical protein